MAFATKAVIPWIEGLLAGITAPVVQHIQRGEPLDPPADVNAYILAGGQQPTRKYTGGGFTRAGRFLVMFVVRVGGEEDDAEDLIADLYDAFELAVLGNPTAGGLAANVELNTAPADNPDYRRMYGPEFRIYPIEVVVTQHARIGP